ncbi:lipopolysaccharide biosynthesis protein [Amedibacillus dolichus]|uniref:lipopolysaccharide biosynthesis protein n=1 Tax=Amedibacillus dolichus TaxID=31971 RepID=UPI001D0112B1|nr:lipopolysaccharide biosynthesis protein [Amedibacillus dolichus]MCB5372179.1 lipopolysaccharide biosynthesis protein [Amedibacillus dolichus]
MNNNSKKIASGMFWKMGERFFAQGVSFLISLVLARILSPDDYGVIAMILVFINLANVFVSNGFSVALIQKKDADELDFSTMFYCSFFISIIIYLVLFIFSPLIGDFYKHDSLSVLLRVLGLKLIINSINSIQHAYISRKMEFKKFFYSTSIGTFISAIAGIYMAYHGFGAWALVAQYLINSIIDTIVLLITVDWKPKFVFSKERAINLLGFGWKVTLADFVATAYNEMRSLVIGRYYTSADLAYYNKSEQFPKLFVNNIMTTVSSVLFPALADVSDEKEKIRNMTRTAIRMTCYIIFPIMVGMIIISTPLVRLLLTDKWLPVVPYLQITCISYAILPLNNTNVQAIKAMGEGSTYLRIELLKKVFGIVIIFLAARISVMAVAVSAVVIAFIYLMINIIPNGKILDYGLRKQMKDIFPSFMASIFMGFIGLVVARFLNCSDLMIIAIEVIVCTFVYGIISYVFGFKEFKMITDLITNIKKRGKKCE